MQKHNTVTLFRKKPCSHVICASIPTPSLQQNKHNYKNQQLNLTQIKQKKTHTSSVLHLTIMLLLFFCPQFPRTSAVADASQRSVKQYHNVPLLLDFSSRLKHKRAHLCRSDSVLALRAHPSAAADSCLLSAVSFPRLTTVHEDSRESTAAGLLTPISTSKAKHCAIVFTDTQTLKKKVATFALPRFSG